MMCNAHRARIVIQNARKEQGVTMEVMSAALGMTRQNYGRKEAGKRNLTYEDFRRIVNFLSLDLENFLEKTDDALEEATDELDD